MKLRLTPTMLAVASLGLAAADWGSQAARDSFLPGGPLDETAHLMTTVVVLWALSKSAGERFLVPALIASVAIDVDHVPGYLGADWLTAGTPRPYTHSLLTVAAVLVGALVWRRRRNVLVGVAIGLTVHFLRDLAEPGTGVSLLWPFSDRSFSLAHSSYVVAMTAVIAIDVRLLLRQRTSAARRVVVEAVGR